MTPDFQDEEEEEERPAKKERKKKEAVAPKPAPKKRKKKDDAEEEEGGGGKKKKKKKDPNAPKRALSAFMRFQLEERKVRTHLASPLMSLGYRTCTWMSYVGHW